VLVYLNEDYEGGETRFLKSGLTVRGQRGDALLFSNVRGDGTPDPDTMHAGLPVTGGKKLLLSRWIRQRPLSA
jgi:prolyl 4-hydroxylase